jgi:hypothetical protein
MRRALLLVTALCLTVAACSSASAPGTTTTPASAAPTIVTTPVAPVTISAYIDSVDLTAHTITVDPIAFLTGAAAKAAFKHDHPTAQEGPTNDYYIQNPVKDHVVLKLSPNAVVRLVTVNGVPHTTPVAVPESKLPSYQSLTIRPFQITSSSGTVTSVVERFVP